MRDDEPPAGYVQFTAGSARVVCAEQLVDSLKAALADSTLYDYASRHPHARALAGRGTAYAVPLPGDADHVVVRHNRHGGALASLGLTNNSGITSRPVCGLYATSLPSGDNPWKYTESPGWAATHSPSDG